MVDPTNYLGIANPPQLFWGPYIWIDGENPRSDGRTWLASDLTTDCTHPSGSGEQKSGGQLSAFFTASPFGSPWFLNPATRGSDIIVTPAVTTGQAPVVVQLTTNAPQGATVYWDFGDGTTQIGGTVTKTYKTAGVYDIHAAALLTTMHYHGSTTISVTEPPAPSPSATPDDIKAVLSLYSEQNSSYYPDGFINMFDVSWVISYGPY